MPGLQTSKAQEGADCIEGDASLEFTTLCLWSLEGIDWPLGR